MTGNKIKIKFALIFYVAILLLLGLDLVGCGTYYDEIGVLKANWDIDMPQPLKIINVASDVGGLPADGTSYSVFEYSDETINELKKLSCWGSAGTIITGGIERILVELKERDEVPVKNKELMKQYSPEVNDSCVYYYKEKRDFNYVIMMLDVINKRVYVFQSST